MKKLLLIAMLLITPSAMAADFSGDFFITGVGARSCGSYVKDLDNQDDSLLHYTYKNWLSGYLTAYNRVTPDTHNIIGDTDIYGINAFVEKYCRENPLKDFLDAVDALIDELHPTRQRTK